MVLSGRDAQQNESLFKRYLRPCDVYVHADIAGASSCIVRAKYIPPHLLLPWRRLCKLPERSSTKPQLLRWSPRARTKRMAMAVASPPLLSKKPATWLCAAPLRGQPRLSLLPGGCGQVKFLRRHLLVNFSPPVRL